MNVYIWEVTDLTDREHSSGGAIAIAETIEAARALLRAAGAIDSPLRYEDSTSVFSTPPSASYATDACAPRVFLFPDAGCC